jgi:hypothetical protein
MIMPKP